MTTARCPRCGVESAWTTHVCLPSAPIASHVPHRCPVCNGTGLVDAGFYTRGQSPSTNPEMCRACVGKGVIFS